MKYFLFVLIEIFPPFFAKGQILYTDFNPDTNLTAPLLDSVYKIGVDINQDSILDFEFNIYSWLGYISPNYCHFYDCICVVENVYPLDTKSKIGWPDTNYYGYGPCYHLTVDSAILISNNSLFWRSGETIKFKCAQALVDCNQGLTKKYIPIKLYLRGNYYFGWIRILGYTIYDMAINLSPNQSLFAGQVLVSENNGKGSILKVSPNPFTSQFKISFPSVLKISTASI